MEDNEEIFRSICTHVLPWVCQKALTRASKSCLNEPGDLMTNCVVSRHFDAPDSKRVCHANRRVREKTKLACLRRWLFNLAAEAKSSLNAPKLIPDRVGVDERWYCVVRTQSCAAGRLIEGEWLVALNEVEYARKGCSMSSRVPVLDSPVLGERFEVLASPNHSGLLCCTWAGYYDRPRGDGALDPLAELEKTGSV